MSELKSLCVDVPRSLADVVSVSLFECGAEGLEERSSGGRAQYIVYATATEISQLRSALKHKLSREQWASVRLSEATVADGWRSRWTDSLRPQRLTDRFTIIPSSTAVSESPDDIVLRPGLTFGFGEHPTTRLCARWIERLCREGRARTVLDIGTGSAVLAIVAARSGAERVFGIDIESRIIEAARMNVGINHAHVVELDATPLSEVVGSFDLVVANVDALTLSQFGVEARARMSPAATLVLAGFLEGDEASLRAIYADVGLTVSYREVEDDWPVWLLEAG